MTADLRDYGFKGGDTMRIRRRFTDGLDFTLEGTVGWMPNEGMVFCPDGTDTAFLLSGLKDEGYELELLKRPQLSKAEANLAITFNDPTLRFAFRDWDTLRTKPIVVTEHAMHVRVGQNFPVVVLHASIREQFLADADRPVTEYDGPLPDGIQ